MICCQVRWGSIGRGRYNGCCWCMISFIIWRCRDIWCRRSNVRSRVVLNIRADIWRRDSWKWGSGNNWSVRDNRCMNRCNRNRCSDGRTMKCCNRSMVNQVVVKVAVRRVTVAKRVSSFWFGSIFVVTSSKHRAEKHQSHDLAWPKLFQLSKLWGSSRSIYLR